MPFKRGSIAKVRLQETDILIVTYNARAILDRCIRSVIRHTRDLPYRLTVVDNASSDGTAAYLKKRFRSKCRVIRSRRNLGFSGGANLGLRLTRQPWVALLDDDVEVTPGWLEKLHTTAQKFPNAGIVGGKVVDPNRRIFCAEFRIVPFQMVGWQEPDRGQRNYLKEADALPGPCWLIPRAVIEKVGPFDEQFFPSQCEDIDYCVRVRLAGYKIIYDGSIPIIHHHLYRTGAPGRSRENDLKFLKKWKKIFHRFPMNPLSPKERLVAEGSHAFEREFQSRHWFLGKTTRLSRWLPEEFYRGLALFAIKDKRGALREFRHVLSALKNRWMSRNNRLTNYYLLSVYFNRLGAQKERDRCLAPVLKLAEPARCRDLFRFFPNHHAHSHLVRLNGWRLQVRADDNLFFASLKKFLPFYLERQPVLAKDNTRWGGIFFANGVRRRVQMPAAEEGRKFSGDWRPQGIRRVLDLKERRVYASLSKKKFYRENILFHSVFLWSLAHLLRVDGASLVHGALLQKNGHGVLILGVKGAGKSTLSASCMRGGYHYFSDEHPILEIKAGRVKGLSFISPIALPPVSARNNFSDLRDWMVWSPKRRKFILRPEKVWPGRIGKTTPVHTVLFPKFRKNASLSIQKMGREDFLKRLMQDEYLPVTLPFEKDIHRESVSSRLIHLLGRTASAFTLEYGIKDIPVIPYAIEKLRPPAVGKKNQYAR